MAQNGAKITNMVKKESNLATQGPQIGADGLSWVSPWQHSTEAPENHSQVLLSSGFILEPAGALFAENGVDLQALICSAFEFVQFADLGYPASSPSVVEPAGDLASVSASSTLT